jgi:hypothetical protein
MQRRARSYREVISNIRRGINDITHVQINPDVHGTPHPSWRAQANLLVTPMHGHAERTGARVVRMAADVTLCLCHDLYGDTL